MFQSFESHASPEQGPPRLALLRELIANQGLKGFLVPRADAHQGEYVAARDARLEWLTGFTGSAGFCVVLPEIAGVFIDGRYRTQVKGQVDLAHFTPVPWPEVQAGAWIAQHLKSGEIGFDPWLHTMDEIAKIEAALAPTGLRLKPSANLIDAIWQDQPEPPAERVFIHDLALAGESHAQKRNRLAAELRAKGESAAVITLPDSLCWLLNIRGSDVPRNPIFHGFGILQDDGKFQLFSVPHRFDAEVLAHLGEDVTLAEPDDFLPALARMKGRVRVDHGTAPLAVSSALASQGIEVSWGDDPCRMPKACKNEAEIEGARQAHLTDGVAMAEFLAWFDQTAPSDLTETQVVSKLENFRRAANALHDISFETIAGSGPNGAIMHYRVTEKTDRALKGDSLMLVDSGGQYKNGTTDITRTIAMGIPNDEERDCYTRVLRGLIAISRARWPRGLAGRDLDALARFNLWTAGFDFNHGTGHGVGAFLSVHEGPQRIARISEVPLEEGMILSNEPGYYREDAFGIRLENLIVVHKAEALGDHRDQLAFETLTFTPFDRRLIEKDHLSRDEITWVDAYHAQVLEKIGPRVSAETQKWLQKVCAPL